METVLWLAYLFLVLLGGIYYVWSLFFGVPYVPSNKKIIEDTIKVLKDPKYKVAIDWQVVEPGAGDGRVAFAVAKAGWQVSALEIIPYLSLWMRLWKFITKQKKVDVFNTDMYKFDYSDYRIALIYLYPKHMGQLEMKLFTEMSKGSLILSNTFAFKEHQHIEKIGKLLVYQVP